MIRWLFLPPGFVSSRLKPKVASNQLFLIGLSLFIPIGPLNTFPLLHLVLLVKMRWNIGSTSIAVGLDAAHPGFPADHPSIPSSSSSSSSSPRPPASCPMHKASPENMPKLPPHPVTSNSAPAKCPIPHDKASDLNPLNSIPKGLSAIEKQPGQLLDLPTDRTASTIPRPKDAVGQAEGEVWDYPSPQQFYNALARKGWETPEESIEMMVFIHNFLNEEAWQEVMKWEKRCPG